MKLGKLFFMLIGFLLQLYIIMYNPFNNIHMTFIYECIIAVIIYIAIEYISNKYCKYSACELLFEFFQGLVIISLMSANHYIIAFIWLFIELNIILE